MKKLADLFSSLFAFIWKFLPYKLNLFFGKVLAFLWVDVFQIRKKVIFDNLDLVFPKMEPKQKKQIAWLAMQNMCRSFFDVIKIPSMTETWIDENVLFDGLENLKMAQDKKKGILFLSLHLGSGDLGGAVISRKLMPIYIITKRFSNQFMDRFWFNLRGASQTKFIDAHNKKNAFEILGALKKQCGVIFVLDQFMGKPYGVSSTFFGKETGSAYGLSLFAKKTNAPVVAIYTYWDNNNKLHVCFRPEIDLSDFLNDEDEVYKTRVTNRFNQELEQIIVKHPEHWMWVHRRWKDFE